jgi:hypothetical protein
VEIFYNMTGTHILKAEQQHSWLQGELMNFTIEIAVGRTHHMSNPLEGAPIVARYTTNAILDLSSYLSSAIDYFSSMVKFERDVEYVTMLVQTYRDHHTISITRDVNGGARVITNQ